MPETLAERHAALGRLLDEMAQADVLFPAPTRYGALLAFARGEWREAGRLIAHAERDPVLDEVRYSWSEEANDILARLESALAPLLGRQ